jgi:hypothetical protein
VVSVWRGKLWGWEAIFGGVVRYILYIMYKELPVEGLENVIV